MQKFTELKCCCLLHTSPFAAFLHCWAESKQRSRDAELSSELQLVLESEAAGIQRKNLWNQVPSWTLCLPGKHQKECSGWTNKKYITNNKPWAFCWLNDRTPTDLRRVRWDTFHVWSMGEEDQLCFWAHTQETPWEGNVWCLDPLQELELINVVSRQDDVAC